MYRITKKLDNTYGCEVMYQDGVDRFQALTEDVAVKKVKSAAKVWNNAKIKRKDIQFFEEQQQVVTKIVPMKKPK